MDRLRESRRLWDELASEVDELMQMEFEGSLFHRFFSLVHRYCIWRRDYFTRRLAE